MEELRDRRVWEWRVYHGHLGSRWTAWAAYGVGIDMMKHHSLVATRYSSNIENDSTSSAGQNPVVLLPKLSWICEE